MKVIILLLLFSCLYCTASKPGVHPINQKSYLEFKYRGPISLSYTITGANDLKFSVYLLDQETYLSWMANTALQPKFIPEGSRLDIFEAELKDWKISDGVYYVVIFNADYQNILLTSYDIDAVPLCQSQDSKTVHPHKSYTGRLIGSLCGGAFVLLVVIGSYFIHRRRMAGNAQNDDRAPLIGGITRTSSSSSMSSVYTDNTAVPPYITRDLADGSERGYNERLQQV